MLIGEVLKELLTLRLEPFLKHMELLEETRVDLSSAYEGFDDGLRSELISEDRWNETSYLNSAAEILLVSIYHSAEVVLRTILAHVDRKTGQDHSKLSRMDDIIEALEAERVTLRSLPQYDQFCILRKFANCWKHAPGERGARFAEQIGLALAKPKGGLVRTHSDLLQDREILSGVRRKLGLKPGDDIAFDVVRSLVKLTKEFLGQAIDAAGI